MFCFFCFCVVLPSTRWLFDFLTISLGTPWSVLALVWEPASEHVRKLASVLAWELATVLAGER